MPTVPNGTPPNGQKVSIPLDVHATVDETAFIVLNGLCLKTNLYVGQVIVGEGKGMSCGHIKVIKKENKETDDV